MSRAMPIPSRRAFTLIELLIVITIVGILLALLMPALAGTLQAAQQVACAVNLHHLAAATQLYLKDHDGRCFAYGEEPNWYFGVQTAGSGEGNRILDLSQGQLAPYLGGSTDVGTCPSVPFGGAYKPKFKNAKWTYGVNLYLATCEVSGMPRTRKSGSLFGAILPSDASRTLVFADSSEVNSFQAPASPSNPMVEDWYYIEPKRRYVHFRHSGRANVLFADWHVEAVAPLANTFDTRMPSARIGYFDDTEVLLKPRGGT